MSFWADDFWSGLSGGSSGGGGATTTRNARTLGQTIEKIRSDLDRGTDYNQRIQDAIISAVEFYRARRYRFNTGGATYDVSSEYTSLSADMMQIDSVVLKLNGTALRKLRSRGNDYVDDVRTDSAFTSEPVYYSIANRRLRVDPAPDQSYSVDIVGHYDMLDISSSTSDSTTLCAWFDEGYELIRTHAMVEILETYIKGQDAYLEADRLRGREEQVEKELKRAFNIQFNQQPVRGCL